MLSTTGILTLPNVKRLSIKSSKLSSLNKLLGEQTQPKRINPPWRSFKNTKTLVREIEIFSYYFELSLMLEDIN